MEEIRHIVEDEFEQSIALSEFAFQYELSNEDKQKRKQYFNPHDTLGYFSDGKLAAKLTILPLHTWIQGKLFSTGGINGVATWPEYRRYGMVGKLMQEALEMMRERGQILSTLSPFASPFYRKYGWETYMERKKYEIKTAMLPQAAPWKGNVRRVDPADQLPVLQQLYERYARQFNGMLKREPYWWDLRILWKLKETVVIYYNEQDEPAGYLMYKVQERILKVREFIYTTEEARMALWKFMANHDSMIESLTLLAPIDDPLCYQLEQPQISQSIGAYFMARIVDVKSFMEQFPFAMARSRWELTMKIEDRYAPWNEEIVKIVSDGAGNTEVTVLESYRQPGIVCNIQTLTLLLVSGRPAQWLKQVGFLQCSDDIVQLLALIVPARTAFLLDSF